MKDVLKASKGMPVRDKKAVLLGKSSRKKKETVYAFRVDTANANADPAQAVTYLMDAEGKTPAHMGETSFDYGDWADAFFMPRPCMLRYDGTVAYYLDPMDYSKRADGAPSDIADPSFEGNAMMEWGKIWFKLEAGEHDGEGYFYVSNKQVDSSYHCWCNYDADDNIIPHFYTAIYNGTGTEKLRSISGVRLTPANGNGCTTGQQELDRALANNTTGAVEWYTSVYADRLLINALLILMGKSLDTQAVFGNGVCGGTAADADELKESTVTGALDQKGLFYGDVNGLMTPVKVFGMENWWGVEWNRTAGLVGIDGEYGVKLTYGTADGSAAKGYSTDGSGYIKAGEMPQNSSYRYYVTQSCFTPQGILPSRMDWGNQGPVYCYCDGFYSGDGYALYGGTADGDRFDGSSMLALSDPFGYGANSTHVSTCLSCKPAAHRKT